jgi:hypothetical protein
MPTKNPPTKDPVQLCEVVILLFAEEKNLPPLYSTSSRTTAHTRSNSDFRTL